MTLSVKHVPFNKLVTILHTRSLVTLPYLASISVVLSCPVILWKTREYRAQIKTGDQMSGIFVTMVIEFSPPISYDLLVRLTFGLLHSTFLIKGHQLFMM